MIDTGSDYTILQPEVAIPLSQAAGIEQRRPSTHNRITLNGVGPIPLTCLIQAAGLSFVDIDGEEYIIDNSILIPRPPEATVVAGQGVRIPSLLGRDVLQRFDFNLSYDPPSVSLTLKE